MVIIYIARDMSGLAVWGLKLQILKNTADCPFEKILSREKRLQVDSR